MLAILSLWLTGIMVAWRYGPRLSDAGAVPLMLGMGYLGGAIIAAVSIPVSWHLFGTVDAGVVLAVHAILLAGVMLPAVLSGVRARPSSPSRSRGSPRWAGLADSVGGGLVLLLLAGEVMLLWVEATGKPLLGWDAWQAWAAKAKVWVLSGELYNFESWAALRNPPFTDAYFGGATHPNLIPWLFTWFMLFHGGWQDSLIGHLYVSLLAAVGLLLYGGLRQMGAPRFMASVITWLGLSMPYVAAHVALPGYADLWLAAFVLAGVIAVEAIWRTGQMRTFATILLIAVVASASTKAPGSIWGCLLLGAGLGAIVPKLRWLAYAGLGSLVLLVASGYVSHLWLPMSQTWWELQATDVSGPLLSLLFASRDWHLLWWMLVAATICRLSPTALKLRFHPIEIFLLGGVVFLGVAFYFSVKATMVIDHTAVTRAILPLALPAVFWLGIVAHELWDWQSSPTAAPDPDPNA